MPRRAIPGPASLHWHLGRGGGWGGVSTDGRKSQLVVHEVDASQPQWLRVSIETLYHHPAVRVGSRGGWGRDGHKAKESKQSNRLTHGTGPNPCTHTHTLTFSLTHTHTHTHTDILHSCGA
jgi:hypothetical protein